MSSTMHSPARLSEQQRRQFERDGYLCPIRVLDDGEAARLLDCYMDYYAANKPRLDALPPNQKYKVLSETHFVLPWVYEIVTHPRVLDAVDPRPPGLILTSFLPEVLARLRELDPAITTGLLIAPHDHGRDLRERATACGAQLLCPHVSQVTDALRSTAARSGPLVVWTVNEHRVLAGLLRDAAVGCVITDVPSVALAIRDLGLSGQPSARA